MVDFRLVPADHSHPPLHYVPELKASITNTVKNLHSLASCRAFETETHHKHPLHDTSDGQIYQTSCLKEQRRRPMQTNLLHLVVSTHFLGETQQLFGILFLYSCSETHTEILTAYLHTLRVKRFDELAKEKVY